MFLLTNMSPAWMSVKSLQWCRTLCDPVDYSLPGFSVHRIFQARILEWVAMPSSRGSSQLRDRTQSSHIAGGFLGKNTQNDKDPHSVQFSHSVISSSLQLHGLQHARPPCPSPTLRVYSNSCPLSQWYYLTISSSIASFSSHFQSFPASRSFLVSQFFASRGQSIGISASASVLPMNIRDWFPLGWTDWFFFLSKGLSRVFSNTTTNI